MRQLSNCLCVAEIFLQLNEFSCLFLQFRSPCMNGSTSLKTRGILKIGHLLQNRASLRLRHMLLMSHSSELTSPGWQGRGDRSPLLPVKLTVPGACPGAPCVGWGRDLDTGARPVLSDMRVIRLVADGITVEQERVYSFDETTLVLWRHGERTGAYR